jgi:hypothetical protein
MIGFGQLGTALFFLGASAFAYAVEPSEDSFSALRAEVNLLRQPVTPEKQIALNAASLNLTACERDPTPPLAPEYLQYIYNGVYAWAKLQTAGGFCVYLVRPTSRPLAIDEARDLLAASNMEFPVPKENAPVPPTDEPKMGRGKVLVEYEVGPDGVPVEKKTN